MPTLSQKCYPLSNCHLTQYRYLQFQYRYLHLQHRYLYLCLADEKEVQRSWTYSPDVCINASAICSHGFWMCPVEAFSAAYWFSLLSVSSIIFSAPWGKVPCPFYLLIYPTPRSRCTVDKCLLRGRKEARKPASAYPSDKWYHLAVLQLSPLSPWFAGQVGRWKETVHLFSLDKETTTQNHLLSGATADPPEDVCCYSFLLLPPSLAPEMACLFPTLLSFPWPMQTCIQETFSKYLLIDSFSPQIRSSRVAQFNDSTWQSSLS